MDGGAWWAAVHGVAKSRTRLSDFPFAFHFHALEKEMATHSSVLAWRIPGTGEPGGLPSMGSHRAGHDWSDLAAAAPYLWDKYLKAGTPVQRINACVIFMDTAKFPSTGIRQICKKFPPATHEKACFSTAWPTEYVGKHSAVYPSAGWEIVNQWALISIFLLVGKVENPFRWVRLIWILPSVTSLSSLCFHRFVELFLF